MVKSRSRWVGLQPSGNGIAVICTESLMSQGGEIGDDRLGDGIGRNPHFDRVAHDVQRAAPLDAGAAS